MRLPIICMDRRLRQFTASFHACFSKPQRRYCAIVLLAVLLCHETHPRCGLLRQVLARVTLSGLSRFLAKAPWSRAEGASTWRTRIDVQVAPWSRPRMPLSAPLVPSVVVVPLHPS